MPSPFPGMDPYLEQPAMWEDFHARLAMEISDQLSPQLTPRYIAALAPRITYEEVLIGESPYTIKPDVAVLQVKEKATAVAAAPIAPPAISAPAVQEIPTRLYTVEIREAAAGALVTAIEILSPVNKRRGQRAYREYQRKRRTLIHDQIHLLEIDLLRRGERFPVTVELPPSPYFVFLQRGGSAKVDIWPISLMEAIPILPVPLLEPDPDVPLDLNQAISNIYERAYYHLRLDYNQPPPKPGLSPEEIAWLQKRLAETGAP